MSERDTDRAALKECPRCAGTGVIGAGLGQCEASCLVHWYSDNQEPGGAVLSPSPLHHRRNERMSNPSRQTETTVDPMTAPQSDGLRAALEAIRDFPTDGDCLPECDSYGHEPLCPYANEDACMRDIAAKALAAPAPSVLLREPESVPLFVHRALALVSRALASREENEAVKRETGGTAPELVQGILDAINDQWSALVRGADDLNVVSDEMLLEMAALREAAELPEDQVSAYRGLNTLAAKWKSFAGDKAFNAATRITFGQCARALWDMIDEKPEVRAALAAEEKTT